LIFYPRTKAEELSCAVVRNTPDNRAGVDPQFFDTTTDRFTVTEVPKTTRLQTRQDPGFTFGIPQAGQPFREDGGLP
jgi:hypothetical protein